MGDDSDGTLLEDARRLLPRIIAVRREIHRAPELGRTLPRTQNTVLRELSGLPLAVATGDRLTSVTATLSGARPGRTVLLRADMDALPRTEETGLDFASRTPGVMHACGHDTHTAMLLGAARLLAARRERLAGRVVFMFQPAEEICEGARPMIEEGVLETADGRPVDAAFALHITTRHASGTLHLRPGPQSAAADMLAITVHGRGAHAAAPQRGLDPVPVACEIVQALQTMVTRTVSVFEPAVLTVTRVTAGTASNIIPDTAEIAGTFRTLSDATREKVRAGIVRVADGVAAAHGLTASVDLPDVTPVVANDPGFTDLVTRAAAELLGPGQVHPLPHPIMAAEDFAFVLQRVPGAMAFLGACPPGQAAGQVPDNHAGRVVYDEQALAVGAAVHSAVALSCLTA
ncbi:amidohydrolase [Streptomyces sp. CB02923]|uniref:M20 metallopeptidase family protein n=1 Tax=Streptomyces sp. CB02923 TaxID=1718985 RepID=UPI000939FD0F|nr:M20 family metallopeptidase [Streptomyces sp. CB02923]OKI02007.1 amidohydrolase [Streptomyces sp. CB02923]